MDSYFNGYHVLMYGESGVQQSSLEYSMRIKVKFYEGR